MLAWNENSLAIGVAKGCQESDVRVGLPESPLFELAADDLCEQVVGCFAIGNASQVHG
jgi:hypothetical protein